MRLVVPKPWMQYILILAGLYNIIWGGAVIIRPAFLFENLNLTLPNYMILWQGVGMINVLFGIGYLIASRKPLKHWPIILLGFICKSTAATVLFYEIYRGNLSSSLLATVVANDLIWLLPFGVILYYAFEYAQCHREIGAYDLSPRKLKSLDNIYTQDGLSLQMLSDRHPTMLIFLRYFGCPFCKESLSEIAANKEMIEKVGTKIVLIHMVSDEEAQKYTDHFHLDGIYRISDPNKKLYKAFGLKKGNLLQLFGINVMLRGLKAGILDRHFFGKFKGDPFQLPGIFLIHKGSVLQTFRHTSAADRPDYIELAKAETCDFNN